MKRILSLAISVILIFCFAITSFAANPVPATDEWLADWDRRTSHSGKIWQSPGAEENDRVFTWLSDNTENSFTYSDKVNKFTLTADSLITVHGVINTVKLYDLKDGTYTYSYTADGITYGNKTFTIAAEDETFTAMFCSDPQLGRSGDDSEEAVANDTYGWERTLTAAKNNGAELILSAGDQVNDGFSTLQYNALFSSDTLSEIPFAPTAGNHDFYSLLFGRYFGNSGVASTGNNYYFSYGNAVFIVLDSNNIIPVIHQKTINDAISAYPDAAWRVVMLHHGAYSAGADEFTNKICTSMIKGYFDTYDIDLVLSGHNHFYSRTYPVYDGEISSIGSVYFEGGSASGSKCGSYDYVNPEYIVHSVTLTEASYSIMYFGEDTIEINSYLTDSDEIFDTFTVVNTKNHSELPPFGLLQKIIAFFENLISYIPMPIR